VPADKVVLEEARRRGVRTAAAIPAWDNVTSNGYGGTIPDRVLVWSERMAEQVRRFQDVPADRVRVRGNALFDRYVSHAGLPGRAELFAELGLDPDRRTILFATCSPRLFGLSRDVAEHLARQIESGAFGPAQLVVRLHPVVLKPGSPESVASWRELAAQHPCMHLDVPAAPSAVLIADTPEEETVRVAALLTHCDVFLNVFSTMTLEACLSDRPTVLVNWTAGVEAAGADAARQPWMRPWIRPAHMAWGAYEHQAQVLEHGAARVAGSMDEVSAHVRAYLDDPGLDRENRRRVAELELGPTDGHAGERIAGELLDLAGARSPAPSLAA
jgi:hypothetical protein